MIDKEELIMKNQKKNFTGIIVLFLISSIFTTVSSFEIDDESEKFKNIILDFTFSEPSIEEIETKEGIYHRVTIDGLPNSGYLDKPCLPVKSVKILIPYGREIDSINIKNNNKFLLKTGCFIEVGKNIIHLANTTYQQYNTKNYSSKFFKNPYSIVGIYKFRGFPILFINLYPVDYDMDTGNISYYDHITLEINTKKSSTATNIRGLQRDIDEVISRVDNPSCVDSYDNTFILANENAVNYVIITNKDLADSGFKDNFQYLAQSKIDKGISAKIFTVEEIENNTEYWVNGTWGDNNPDNIFYESEIIKNYRIFNDTQAKIRNFIRYAYLELETDYVLLGGDADVTDEDNNIIPCRGLFANESGLPLYYSDHYIENEEDDIPSDVYYACLDGNFNYDCDMHFGECADRNNFIEVDEADLSAEVWVGRACVDSEKEVAYFVMKTLGYENSDRDPYISKILLVGEYLGFPGVSAYGGNYKDEIIPIIPVDYNVDTLYDRNQTWSKNDIIEILNNATPHIINHDGHSSYSYNMKMGINDVDSLENNKYFFAYSHGCMAGGFDNPTGYDCIAEHFTVETPYGAFAVIMNARFGLGSENNLNSPSQLLDISFFKAIFTKNIRQLGRANHYSKEDHIWHIDENGIRWVYYETNLFGDPEVSIKNRYSSIITHPENDGSLYILNKKICSIPLFESPIIIGKITVQAEVSSELEGQVYAVEFYFDNEYKHVDNESPYKWELNTHLIGRFTIAVIVYFLNGENKSESLDIIAIIPKRKSL